VIYTVYQQDDFRRSVSAPYAIASQIQPSTYLGIPSLPTFSRPQTQWGYALEHSFTNGTKIKQQVRQTQYRFIGSSFFPQYKTASPDEVKPGGGALARQTRILSLDNQISHQFNDGSYQHLWLLGMDQTRYTTQKQSGRAAPVALNFRTPIYPDMMTPELSSLGSESIVQQGFYGLYRFAIDQFAAFNIGMRHSQVDNQKHNASGMMTSHTTLSHPTLSTGLIALNETGWSPFVSYSQSFEPLTSWEPIFDGRASPTVSHGKQQELGVKWKSANQRHSAVMSYFDIHRDNIYNAVAINQQHYSAASEQRHRGIEVETTSSWRQGIDLKASYTWLDATVSATQLATASGDVGTRPFGVPTHTASAWLTLNGAWVNIPDYELTVGARYVDDRLVNLEGDQLAGYATLDVGVRYQMDALTAYASVKNVTNETYGLGPYFGNINVGTPQTWLAGINIAVP
jgi:iron complex outermembrane receptor protein